jgi:hypothetical protein
MTMCILEWYAPRIPSLDGSGVMIHAFNLLVCQLRASRSGPRGRYDLVRSGARSCFSDSRDTTERYEQTEGIGER